MTSESLGLIAGIVVGFPIALVTMGTFVGHVLAAVGGWRGLASRWPAPPDTPSGRLVARSSFGRVGVVNYNGVLNVYTSALGLHLSLTPSWFPGHPAILVPWDAIQTDAVQRSWLPWLHNLPIDGGWTLSLSADAVEAIRAAAPR